MTSPKEWMRKKVAESQVSGTGQNTTQQITVKTATSNTSSFPYAKDVGVPSIAGIEMLARSSGLEIKVISTYRPGANGYHGTQNAVDFGGSASLRRQLAAYLYQFSQYILELIYTDRGVQGGGFYVHNGQRVPQSFYDGPDVDNPRANIITNHEDHVHLATTMSGLRAMSANSEQIAKQALEEAARTPLAPTGQNSNLLTGEPLAPQPKRSGCLPRLFGTAAAVSMIPIGVLVYFL